jgi:N-acetylmuramoyl-L-alanine amidase
MTPMRLRVVVPILCAAVLLAAPAASNAAVLHLVAPGESLFSIAAADGLSVSSLAAANGLSPTAFLTAGSTVVIPPQGAVAGAPMGATSTGAGAATSSGSDEPDCDSDDPGDGDGDADDCAGGAPATTTSSAAPVSSAGAGTYVVAPGDTLTGVAARLGVSRGALAAANGLSSTSFLIAGSVLHTSGVASAPVSTTVPVSATTTTLPQTSTQPVGAAAQGNPTAPPYPTPERMTAGQIGSIASSQGVSSSLADAIAWQESGFNNDLVSSADARGIMQITPGTWAWIQHSLDSGAPLAPASAADNVRGGSIMLNWLLNQTGGDPAMAAAGYYQGLSSVRARGMYTDTQAYVQNIMTLRHHFGG